MPLEPGYGQYPVNKSTSISAEQNQRIVDVARELRISQSEVMRRALDAGLDALTKG